LPADSSGVFTFDQSGRRDVQNSSLANFARRMSAGQLRRLAPSSSSLSTIGPAIGLPLRRLLPASARPCCTDQIWIGGKSSLMPFEIMPP
jgi:hypothetical protein